MPRNGKEKLSENAVSVSAAEDFALESLDWRAALIDLSFEPIFAWDWEKGIIEWNTGAEKQYGFTRAEALGKTSHELLSTKHPLSLKRFLKKLESEGYWLGELRHTTKDKRELIVESRQQILTQNGHRIVMESNRDITERREGESQIALLIVIGDLIRKVASYEELLFTVSKVVGHHLKVRRCFFNEIDLANDQETVFRDYCRGVESVAGKHKLSIYSPVTTAEMMAGRTVSNSDSSKDPRTAKLYKTIYEPAGERSYIAVPLMREGTWKASLWVSDDQPREWTLAEIMLLEAVAERVWLSVEKKRSEIALSDSEQQFRAVFSQTSGGITQTDLEGKFLLVNDRYCEIVGRTREELLELRIQAITHPDDKPAIVRQMSDLVNGGPNFVVENRCLLPDGGEVWVHSDVAAIRNSEGRIQHIVAAVTDITDRKRAESILDRYRLLSETSDDIIWFIRPDGIFMEVNRSAVETYGYSREEFLTMSIRDLRHPAAVDKFQEQLTSARNGNTHFETLHIAKDGTAIPVDVNAAGCDFGGERLIMAIVRNITDRKRSDEALRKSEELFSRFMQYLPGLAWIKDGAGKYVYANEAAETAFHTPRKELYGKTDDEVFPPDIATDFKKNDQLALEKQIGLQTVETLEHHDGVLHHSLVSKFPIFDAEGRPAMIGGMAIDITDRVQAEAALRESEQRRKLAQEAGNVGVFDWDIVANKTYWSETMWSIYGETETAATAVNPDEEFWSSRLHESDRERVKLNIKKALRSKDDEFRDEFRVIWPDGSIRWIESRAAISRDELGNATQMYGVNTDITSRKEVEEKIRVSDNQLRLITNAVPALISYVDKNKHYRFANHAFTTWFGIEAENILGKEPRDIFGEKAYKTLRPHIEDTLSGKKCNFETDIWYPRLGARYVHVSYIPDLGADGTVYGYYGLTHDLTELKLSRDRLRSSEERLGLMMESLTDYAIFSIDLDGLINSWNKGAQLIFGYESNEIMAQPYASLFTEEDIANDIPGLEIDVARKKNRSSVERWLVKKGGDRFFAHGVLMPLHADDAVAGYVNIVSDLTEKMRHAEELQKAHDELELRVKERTADLAEANATLLEEIHERESAEKQRLDLLERLVSSQELERRRIARDLHDQMGQRLTALRLKIASLLEISPESNQFLPRVSRLQEIAQRLDSEVSFLAWELRPTTLDDLGFVDAVAAFVNEWSRHYEIAAEFHASGLPKDRFERDTETHLYRIVQEALNNTAKHAEAERVTVLIEGRGPNLILIVEDDGKGFDPTKKQNVDKSGKGLGLIGIRERAILIGGDIEIESALGKGTTIYIRIPFPV